MLKEESADTPAGVGAGGDVHRLLVLDDDEQIVAMIRRIAARAGCNVVATTDTAVFLRYLDEFSPTVVLVDVFLGNRDCTMLLDALAGRQGRSRFRLLFMSGMGESALMLVGRIARERGIAVDRLIYRKRDLFQLEDLLRGKNELPARLG
ncbi:MAG: response regulator [Burkholderiales bacterium]|nr:response regulator [Burkholderiales bacterium]